MPLIDEVTAICNRLASKGWAQLFAGHGLDITSPDLKKELGRELPNIDRSVPGFEDFAFEGKRGIEPGNPARSLLYHALASPNVLQVNGTDLAEYPTLRDIETVENYVFGAKAPSLAELSALAAGDLMAVVVFATEYRPAVDSVHRKHADMCFSRTGLARVGTVESFYDSLSRGFTPFAAGDDHGLRVLPARYGAYIAVQRLGNETTFGPMRFNFRLKHPEFYQRPGEPPDPGDGGRKFWVPLHKLFSGSECLQHHDLQVSLQCHHVNEKIRRIHIELRRRGKNSGWAAPDIDRPPFRFTDGIAELSSKAEFGTGVVVPVAHPALVEAALYQGHPLTFLVPKITDNEWSPSLQISSVNDLRHAPEYVHARHVPGDPTPNLNDLPNASDIVNKGGYRAQHYVDFTGDGWIEPVCPQLKPELPRFIAAYSLVTAPDFFFNCDQREVMDWWFERAPTALRDFLWETPPLALSDERYAPNLKLNNTDFHSGDSALPQAGFRPEDDTVTAIVSIPQRGAAQDRPLKVVERNRHTHLTDGAAGVFAPGWDTSHDKTGATLHLAAYGLGSPFPEDSKLCAALSTFWPAVAPDAGRSFSAVFPTVSPLTDEETGQVGTLPWDGVAGPRVVQAGGTELVEYASFPFVDYVENALTSKFSVKLTGQISTRRYVARVLAMARAYKALGVKTPAGKRAWDVLSFREVQSSDAELNNAETEAGVSLAGEQFRFEMYRPGNPLTQPTDHRRAHKSIGARTILFVGGNPSILIKTGGDPWRFVNV